MSDELVRVRDLKKIFSVPAGELHAVDGVDFSIARGSTIGIVGESGCGKSTMGRLLAMLLEATSGEILFDGQNIAKKMSKAEAMAYKKRIQMIFQDPFSSLNPRMTTFETIIEPLNIHRAGTLQEREARVYQLMETVGLSERFVNAYPHELDGGRRQRIGIARALALDPEFIICDEPVSALDVSIQAQILKLMNDLKREHGTSILFITHKLNEIMAVADRCTVLRKGKYMGTVDIKDTTKEELSRMMVGRDVQLQVDKKPAAPGEVVLDVQNVTMHNAQHKKDAVKNVSFQVRGGEIVCLAGIEGNGQTEFVYGLTGLEKFNSGKVLLDGKEITNESIRQRSKDGMSHIPEDRHKHGLVLDYSLENNMVLQRYWQPEFQHNGFIRSEKVREYSDKLIAQYDVRSGQGSATIVRSMSGGNQQKAIIAREIDKDPKLLVAVQPTRGLDVGAIEYIHKQIVDERDRGKAVLLVSLELDEVMNLSDRILVMYEGEIVGEFDPKTTTVQELGLYMAGARKQGKE